MPMGVGGIGGTKKEIWVRVFAGMGTISQDFL